MQRLYFWPFLLLAGGVTVTAQADCMGPYPPSMVKAFNENCTKDVPQTAAFCSCIMDQVQKNIPLAEFIEIGNSPAGINSDKRFIEASKKCEPQLPSTTPSTPAAAVTPSSAPGASSPAVSTPTAPPPSSPAVPAASSSPAPSAGPTTESKTPAAPTIPAISR